MTQRGQLRKAFDGRIPLRTDRATSQEGGGAAARAPPPCLLTPQRSEGPNATRCGREPPTRWGLAAAFPPDALPLRAVVTTRRQPPQRRRVHLVPVSGAILSVRKRTRTASA